MKTRLMLALVVLLVALRSEAGPPVLDLAAARRAEASVVEVRAEFKLPRPATEISPRDWLRPLPSTGDVTRIGSGLGFVVDRDGYILTAAHVVAEATKLTVKLPDGKEMKAELVGYDRTIDTALLKIERTEIRPLDLGDSDSLNVGEGLLLFDRRPSPQGPFRTGTLQRRSSIQGMRIQFLEITGGAEPGSGGGPVIDPSGKVVGIVAATLLPRSGPMKPSTWAVPINAIKETLTKLSKGLKRDLPLARQIETREHK